CVSAGFGAERLLAGEVSLRRLAIGAASLAGFGLLAAIGALDGLAQALAAPELVSRAIEHAAELHAGGLRLVMVAALGGGALLAVRSGRLKGVQAAAALCLVVFADLWSVDREFFTFESPAAVFGGDAVTTRMRQTPLPFRVWDPKGGGLDQLGVYPGSWLMGLDIPQLLSYHGQELNAFDQI